MNRPVFLIGWILVFCFPLATRAADWPRFRGPDLSGISPEKGIARSWPKGGPPVVWSRKLSEGHGTASVHDGEVYVVDRPTSREDVLLCLDLHSGRELWRCAYGAPATMRYNRTLTAPTVDEDYVYTATPMSDICCISRSTHRLVWRKYLRLITRRAVIPAWGFGQHPVVYKDTVIAVVSTRDRGFVIAFDKSTGEVRWESEPLEETKFCYSTPLVAKLGGIDQLLLFTIKWTREGPMAYLRSLDPDNGKPLWKALSPRKYNVPVPQPVVIGDDRVFVAGGYHVGCFGLRVSQEGDQWQAEQLFENQNCTPHLHTPILFRDHFYVQSFDGFHNETNAGLVCLDLDGNLKWQTGPDVLFENGNILLADGLLFVMNAQTGDLSLVEATPDEYRPLCSAKIFDKPIEGQFIWAPMALSCGKLLVRDFHGLKCLDVAAVSRGRGKDGSGVYDDVHPPVGFVKQHIRWTAKLPGADASAPIAIRSKVFVAANPAVIACYDTATGKLLWQHKHGGNSESSAVSTPWVHGDSVYAAFGNGTVVCCDINGRLRWSKTVEDTTDSTPFVEWASGVLAVQLDGLHGLDAATGRTKWSISAKQAGGKGPFSQAVVGKEHILVTSRGTIVRVRDGEVVAEVMPNGKCVASSANEEVVYVIGSRGNAEGRFVGAYRLECKAQDKITVDELWLHTRSAKIKHIAGPILYEGRIFALTASGAVEVIAADTGRLLGRKQIPSEVRTPGEECAPASNLLMAGGRLYVTNVGPEYRTVILRCEPELEEVGQYAVDGGGPEPGFYGRSQYVCAGTNLYCLGGFTPTLPEEISSTEITPAAATNNEESPCTPFVTNEMPTSWLFAGPAKPASITVDFLSDLGGRENARPQSGQTVKHAGQTLTFVDLAEEHFWKDERFTGGYRSIDITGACSGRGESTAFFYTLIENDEPRWVRLHLLTPAGESWNPPEKLRAAAWLASQPVTEGDFVRLQKGKYPLMIQVQIGEYDGSGKIWFAPRLEDFNDRFVSMTARNKRQWEMWNEYQKTEDQLFTLGRGEANTD